MQQAAGVAIGRRASNFATPPSIVVRGMRVYLSFSQLFEAGAPLDWKSTDHSNAIPSIEAAISCLADVGMADAVAAAISNIVIFQSERNNSFFHPSYPRTIFINLDRSHDKFHLIEEIVHQTGHSLLHELSPDGSLFVEIDAEFVSTSGAEADDHGGTAATVRFHSMVTLALICQCYVALLQRSSELDAVLMGRLAFAARKLAPDIQDFLAQKTILQNPGLRIIRTVLNNYGEMIARHGGALTALNLDGQPYVFDNVLFRAANAL
ncbi:hypothetical protein [Devosia sp. XK-2]|uniref:hypothetical protein n=1 Tax=Devosia sp. XK-2 TaxID=3126689 RepID=UPI0030D2D1ED